MIRNFLCSALFLIAVPAVSHAETTPSASDTLRATLLDEAVVLTSPKETSGLRSQALSATTVEPAGANSMPGLYAPNALKDAATQVANLHMPAYGSRLTSATYMRGIGTRSGTPAVGLYVDNMPFIDKSAFDFGFIDVVRVDVLRGPQGTLYGRNTMGGLLLVTTADPIRHYGTDIALSATSRGGGRHTQVNTVWHGDDPSFAVSLGGFYEGLDGFYRNITTGEKADRSRSAGMKTRWAWQANSRLRLDLNLSYEYSHEHSNPYVLLADTITKLPTGKIQQNRQSTYRRNLLNAGLGVAYKMPKALFSSLTSFQLLEDRLFMDQDFTSLDLFSLTQRQKQQSLSQELTLKSRGTGRWQWTNGLSGSYQWLRTSCPVNFYSGGMAFLNTQMSRVFAGVPHAMTLTFDDPTLAFNTDAKTPNANVALFHQTTLRNLIFDRLSLTAGLRLEYDWHIIDLLGTTAADVAFTYAMPSYKINAPLTSKPELRGEFSDGSWQLLPKVALQYDFGRRHGNVYALVSKGYRSGGYNIQNCSDLSQTLLRREMMIGVEDYVVGVMSKMPMPDAVKEKAIAGMKAALEPQIPASPDLATLAYEPETSWNYEVGTHLNFESPNAALTLDAALFLIDTKNQQLSRFADSGLGRVLVNAGKSRSMGGEVQMNAAVLGNRLNIGLGYGYTRAVFTNYDLGVAAGGLAVDYTDNRVPFVPEHTFNVALSFNQPVSETGLLRNFFCGANLNGAGKVYWDEANSMSEPLYATLSARVGVKFAGNVSLSFWGKNLTGKDYHTFQFVNMGRSYAQLATPRHFGMDLSIHF